MVEQAKGINPNLDETILEVKDSDKGFYHLLGLNAKFDQLTGTITSCELRKFSKSPNVWETMRAEQKTAKYMGFQKVAILHNPRIAAALPKEDFRELDQEDQDLAKSMHQEGQSVQDIAAALPKKIRQKDVQHFLGIE